MTTKEIRRRLFDYIRDADDKKVKAMYTMLENEIELETEVWTEEFLDELINRTAEFENGKIKGYTWEEVKQRAKKYASRKTS